LNEDESVDQGESLVKGVHGVVRDRGPGGGEKESEGEEKRKPERDDVTIDDGPCSSRKTFVERFDSSSGI